MQKYEGEVKMVKLGDVCTFNGFKQCSANELLSLDDKMGNGEVKLLPSSADYNLTTSIEKAGTFLNDGEVITLGVARYANMKYHKGLFCSANNYLISSKDNSLSLKYLFYFLKDKVGKLYPNLGGMYPQLNRDGLKNLEIPLPSLEEQKRIVGQLNYFTSILDTLKSLFHLSTSQYEYYRNQFLNYSMGGAEPTHYSTFDKSMTSTISSGIKRFMSKRSEIMRDMGN